MAIFGALLAAQLARAALLFVTQDWEVIRFLYPVDFGEGALLDQSIRLARFEPIYRIDLATPPYIVDNYPPLFALIQVPFVWLFGPAYWYGRVISCVSILVAAVLIGCTLYTLTEDRLAGLICGALLLACPHVLYWSALDRIDALALAFSCAGLYVIVRHGQAWKGLISGTLLFTAAIYTRQSYALVAPATAFVWLLSIKQRPRAVQLAGFTAALNLSLFAVLDLLTQGGFFFHIVTANVNYFSWEVVWTYVKMIFIQMPVMVFAVLFASVGLLPLDEARRRPAWWVITPYFCASLLTAVTIGKVGSNVNYLFELMVAFCLAVGEVIALTRTYKWARTLVFAAVTLQVYALVNWSLAVIPHETPILTAQREELYKMVQTTPGTVLADEALGMIPLSGRELYIQPFAQKQLADAALWDQQPFINAIRRDEFSVILLYKHQRAERWTNEMLSAIQSSYRLQRSVG
ncbi:MAG TPA: glycosyltransferase family 39 protein, partial [Anaerolineae bacterium]